MGILVDKSVAITWFEKGVYGYRPISIDNYNNDSEPEIQPGFVEISGDLYEVDTAEAITGWSLISNSTQAYIVAVPAGSLVAFVFVSTAPVWSHSKQGWYVSNNRYLFAVYKDGSGNYTKKCEMGRLNHRRFFNDLFVDGYLTAKGVATKTPTIELVSKAVADGTTTEYSDEFYIQHPCTVRMGAAAPTSSGTLVVEMQIYTDGAYDDLGSVAGQYQIGQVTSGVVTKYCQPINPGYYRLKITKSVSIVSAPIISCELVGIYGDGSSI